MVNDLIIELKKLHFHVGFPNRFELHCPLLFENKKLIFECFQGTGYCLPHIFIKLDKIGCRQSQHCYDDDEKVHMAINE